MTVQETQRTIQANIMMKGPLSVEVLSIYTRLQLVLSKNTIHLALIW